MFGQYSVVSECHLWEEVIPELWLGYHQDLECDEAGLEEQEAAHQETGITEQMPVADVGRVTRLCRVDNPISLEQVLQAECEDREELGESHLAMAHHGCPRPQRGGGPLVVEGGSDAAGLELGPVAEVEAGAVQEVVVGRGEAVH